MKAPEVKNLKKAENALFRSFDPEIHFWAQKSLFEHFEHFGALLHFFAQNDQKWLHASLWNIGRERFWQKVELLTQKCSKMLKMVKMEPFLIFDLKSWFSAHFLNFRTWRGRLRKTVKNLVEYEDFWEPESQKTHFGLILAKFHIFAFWRSKTQKSHFCAQNEKNREISIFLRFGGPDGPTHPHTHIQRTGSSVAPPFSRLWNEARGRVIPPPTPI